MKPQTSKPLISVIIPVFNGEKYLAEAIDSVLSQKDFELDVIVVDDGSTDGTRLTAQKYIPHVRYIYQENKGPGAARNKGIREAHADYFSFLDADDLWTSHKIMRQLEPFDVNPDWDMVCGYIENFYSPELSQSDKDHIRIPHVLMPGYHVDTLLIKRNSFLRVGLFKDDLRIGETIDWFARANEMNLSCLMLPDVLAKRRIHKTNLGILQRDQRSGYVRTLKAALDRRRITK